MCACVCEGVCLSMYVSVSVRLCVTVTVTVSLCVCVRLIGFLLLVNTVASELYTLRSGRFLLPFSSMFNSRLDVRWARTRSPTLESWLKFGCRQPNNTRISEGPAHLHIPTGKRRPCALRLRHHHPRVVHWNWKRKRMPPSWHVRLALLTFEAIGSGAASTCAASAISNTILKQV